MATPEVLTHSDLEVAPEQSKPRIADKYYANDPSAAPEYYYNPNDKPARTICGLRATTFFLTVALILVIIVAAVGGGVGGTVAVNNAKRYLLDSTIHTKLN